MKVSAIVISRAEPSLDQARLASEHISEITSIPKVRQDAVKQQLLLMVMLQLEHSFQRPGVRYQSAEI